MRLFLQSDSPAELDAGARPERPCSPGAQVLFLKQAEKKPFPTPCVSSRDTSSPGRSGGTSSPSLVAALKSLPRVGGRQQGRQVPLSAGWMLHVESCWFFPLVTLWMAEKRAGRRV